MTVEILESCVVDESWNSASHDGSPKSIQRALHKLSTLKDCVGCFDCVNCYHCTDCSRCEQCTNCVFCEDRIGEINLDTR